MTEDEFKAPPEDTEIRLYESWSELTPRMACRSTFWANFTCRHIEDQKVNAVYLAANGGNLPGGAERIDRALMETGNEQPQMIDRTVRNRPTTARRPPGSPRQPLRLRRLPFRAGLVARTPGGTDRPGRYQYRCAGT